MDQLTAMRAFVRIAETGSFSAVARENNTTQATISKRIAALEEFLGVRLLIRSSREQSLTEAGKAYYKRSIDIIEAVDEADNCARCQTDAPRGTLRITAPVDFSNRILPSLIREFMDRYPDITLDLILNNHRLDLIAEGIDIAIRADQFKDSSLIAKPLCSNSIHVVASPEYLEKNGTPETPQDLLDHECLQYSVAESPHIWTFIHEGKKIRVPITGKLRCDNGDFQIDMVLAGKGISIIPWWLMHEEVDKGHLKVILKDYTLPTIPLNIVYPDRKYLPLKTRTFIDFIVEKSKEHPAFQ